MTTWIRSWSLLFVLFAFTGLCAFDAAEARADGCDDCKQRCRDGVQKCKDAAPKRLCKGPAKIVCDMFKNFQCPASGTICRKIDCGVGGPCNSPPPDNKGGHVVGDPHLYSLDRTRFDFQAVGEFVIARSSEADLEVQARLVPHGQRVSVVQMAAIRSGGHQIVFEAGKGIVVDSQSMMLDQNTIFVSEKIAISYVSESSYLVEIGESNLWVKIQKGLLDLYLDPGQASQGTWQGLLGDFDGNPDNDFKTRAGKLYEKQDMTREVLYRQFGESWRITQAESILLYGDGETTETFTDKSFPSKYVALADLDREAFAKAHALCVAKGVREGEALRNCIYDVGLTGSEDFAEGYVGSQPFEAMGALLFPGKLGMQVQTSSYQGSSVPVFWSGALAEPLALTLVSAAGKKVASDRPKGENPILFRLPSEIGSYTLQLKQGEETIERPIEVTEAKATITAPDSVEGAAEFTLSWTGPLGQGDYIAIVKGGETNTSTHMRYIWAIRPDDAYFQAPATPGDYELWYVLQGASSRAVIARKTIHVGEAHATVKPQSDVTVGGTFAVEWTGPNGRSDYIDLVSAGYTKTGGQISYDWVKSSKEGKVSIRGPLTPGAYEVRYIAETSAGRAVLATTALEVRDVKADFSFPPRVVADEKFEISWTGPNYPGDYIAIGTVGAKDGTGHLHYLYSNKGGKAELLAPKEPGPYEITYVLTAAGGRRVLTRKAIEVTAK